MTKTYIGKVLLVLLSLVISNCGGGTTVNVGGAPISSTAVLNADKFYGFYGDCNVSCFSEYSRSVSYYHTPPWSHDVAAIAGGISAGIASNKSIILSIPDGDAYAPDCDLRITNFLLYLDSQNLLRNIYAIYPKDEPNLNAVKSATEILTANSCVRNAISKFSGVAGKPLMATYSCSDPWIALEDFDIIACDDYEIGDLVLTKYLPELKKYGKPIFLIPGGACPWNYNPYSMVVAANADDQIVGIMAFIYPDSYGGTNYCGIKSSTLSAVYLHIWAGML